MTRTSSAAWRVVNPAYWYPAGFAAGYVLLSFTATPTPLIGLWRPLIFAVGGTVALQISLAVLLRDARRASVLTSLTVLALSAAWLLLAVAVVIGVWWFIVNDLRRRRGARPVRASWERVTASLRAFAVIFALVTAVPAADAARASIDLHPPEHEPVRQGHGPDITILLLDGYPRSDVLLSDFGYDNSWFEAELEHRGFAVADMSRSNYTATWVTLASMFHMRYAEDIPELHPPPSDPAEQYRRLMRAISTGPGLDLLRAQGYRISTVPIQFTSTAILSADDFADSGHMTTFELSLVQHSSLRLLLRGPIADWILDQQRARLQHGLDVAARPTADDGRPRFWLIHLLSPHAPILYEADGRPTSAPECFPDCSLWAFHNTEQEAGLAAQLHHLNNLVLDALDARIEQDPEAVVIILSDHGTRRIGAPPERAFQSFFASRTPGREDVFAQDASPVNVLRQLSKAYLGTELVVEPYRAWQSEPNEPLTLSPFDAEQ